MKDSSSNQDSAISSCTGFVPRLQLITGKGGVGRTTISIALAQAFAQQNQNVLLLEVRDADSELTQEDQVKRLIKIKHFSQCRLHKQL